MKKIFLNIVIFLLLQAVSTSLFAQTTVVANNDSVSFTVCQTSIDINILANDTYTCTQPIVTILDNPFTLAQIGLVNDSIVQYVPYITSVYFGKTDSIRYQITCNGVSDTATIYIKYPTSYSPAIAYTSSLNKECFSQGDTITQTTVVTNNCPNQLELELDLYFTSPIASLALDSTSIVSSTNVTIPEMVKDTASYAYLLIMQPNSSFKINTYYTVRSMNGGADSAAVVGDIYYQNDGFYMVNKIMSCPDRKEIIKTCDSIQHLNLSSINVTSYQIVQQPKQVGASASLSSTGIFVYTPANNISTIETDSVEYSMNMTDGSFVTGKINITILPCIGTVQTSSTQNDLCNNDSCKYDGPSILINEVMIAPKTYDGAIYGQQCDGTFVGGEWIELYNPDKCNAVDISGYFFANATVDQIGSGCSGNDVRNLGAGFVLPPGTVVPSMGFCVLRGEFAQQVDSGRLLKNGGNTVVVNLVDYFNRFCLNNGGIRFWLADHGGWVGFYDNKGVPQDAIYWGDPTTDICSDCTPCNPQVAGSYTGQLASLDAFPTNRKNRVTDFDVGTYLGNSVKRQPDGGNWAFDVLTSPTIGYCNSICNTRENTSCNGTATVTVSGGTGNFLYQWNDSLQQTTPTATHLCEGTYCVTITDTQTQLQKVACVTITNSTIKCPPIVAVNDTVNVFICKEKTISLSINPALNDKYTCAVPQIKLLTQPTFAGATATITTDNNGQNIISYNYTINGKAIGTDSIRYQIACQDKTDSAWVYIKLIDDTLKLKTINVTSSSVAVTVEGGMPAYQYSLMDGSSVIATGQFSTTTDTLKNLSLSEGKYYSLQLMDSKLCAVTVDSFKITNGQDNMYLNETICEGKDYIFYNNILTKSGTYTQAISSDTTVILNLKVNPIAQLNLNDSICLGGTYLFNGKSLVNQGIYRDTLNSALGCDSIVTLNLTYKKLNAATYLTVTINQGETYHFGGNELSSSGVYTDTLHTTAGCDSIVVLNLLVILKVLNVVIPDIFSPNGDGVNDYFEIQNLDQYPENNIIILNRWGDKVFEEKPYKNDWDGRNHFGLTVGGDELPVATYFYLLDLGNGTPVKKGFVYLTR
jgi:gliding motility-associated-like protein